jgi:hypothetical protein
MGVSFWAQVYNYKRFSLLAELPAAQVTRPARRQMRPARLQSQDDITGICLSSPEKVPEA